MDKSESWATSPGVAKSMRGNRRRDTSLELLVRRALHAKGFRYRVDYAPLKELRSRADIVFTRAGVAVYLDGCFWHGCPIHGTTPVANADYWIPKLERNKERDAYATRILAEGGWTVLRFWEHEDPAEVVKHIATVLQAIPSGAQHRAES
ncbi:very short patch repair endonuclease [Herbiconiux liangxiaofengii]|uniref:very short patch repair endonuclease n=1 Tax=Herbiconiux liangxiaofengii TaxID=3342795 RepID=UPI0035B92291